MMGDKLCLMIYYDPQTAREHSEAIIAKGLMMGADPAILKALTGQGSDDKHARVKTTKAGGTTATTKVRPFANAATNEGINTVVLPEPMIIWRSDDFLDVASRTNDVAVATCASRNTRSQARSNKSRRAS